MTTTTTTTTTTTDVFVCDRTANFVQDADYRQITLTNGCPDCFGDPKYGGEESKTCNHVSVAKALAYCKAECADKSSGCTGFFFQKHGNGHEICGFYLEAVNASNLVKHGHQQCSQVCIMQTTTTTTTTTKTSTITDVACENPGHWTYPACTQPWTGSCHGQARLGKGKRWSAWKDVDGEFPCTIGFFGRDPWPGQAKRCVCKEL